MREINRTDVVRFIQASNWARSFDMANNWNANVLRGSVIALVFSVSGLLGACASLKTTTSGKPIEHHIAFRADQPADQIRNARLRYGELPLIEAPVLNHGGVRKLGRVPIPETAEIEWTDASGGQQKRVVPIKSRAPTFMTGKTIRFEIQAAKLEVYVLEFAPHAQPIHHFIYAD